MTNTQHPLIPILLLTALILSACNGILYTPPTAAEYCDIDPALLEPETTAEISGKTVIELWAAGERNYCWRAYAPLIAAHQRPDLSLAVRVHNLEMNSNPFANRLMELAARGEAPDVANVSISNVIKLGEAGYLHPLEECIKRSEFQHIPQEFWHSFSIDGRVWGVPMENEVHLLFYNKELLKDLGWTDKQIDTLPTQILDGAYTSQDMIATARQAIATGIVEPGLAFIPSRAQYMTIIPIYMHLGGKFINVEQSHLQINRAALEEAHSFFAALYTHKLFDIRMAVPRFDDWGNKLLVRDAATHNRFLFWRMTITEMQNMAEVSSDASGDAVMLSNRIGVSLLPSATNTRAGYAHLSHSGQHVIFAESATGRNKQLAACDLLAATHASDLLKEHAEKSGYVTFSTDSKDGLYLPDWFPTDLPIEHVQFRPPIIPEFDDYITILGETTVLVERGELTASEAADVAIERLRDTFGDQLIIE